MIYFLTLALWLLMFLSSVIYNWISLSSNISSVAILAKPSGLGSNRIPIGEISRWLIMREFIKPAAFDRRRSYSRVPTEGFFRTYSKILLEASTILILLDNPNKL